MYSSFSTYRKNKSLKLQLKHLNDVYFIFRNLSEDKDLINEKLKNYLLSERTYSEQEIQEAKENYARNARNYSTQDW